MRGIFAIGRGDERMRMNQSDRVREWRVMQTVNESGVASGEWSVV